MAVRSPVLIMTDAGMPGCSGLFGPETEIGRVTGNNAVTWSPSLHDWYETVKLNYGHDFTRGRDTSHLPGPDAPPEEVPKTWRTMDAILAYWQELGVDGFRADMAHMIPMEFWRWSVRRARRRDREEADHEDQAPDPQDRHPVEPGLQGRAPRAGSLLRTAAGRLRVGHSAYRPSERGPPRPRRALAPSPNAKQY